MKVHQNPLFVSENIDALRQPLKKHCRMTYREIEGSWGINMRSINEIPNNLAQSLKENNRESMHTSLKQTNNPLYESLKSNLSKLVCGRSTSK